MSIVNITTGETIRVRSIIFGTQVEYPSIEFPKLSGKPQFHYEKDSAMSLAALRYYAKEFLTGGTITNDPILQYLVLVCESIKETLKSRWESYGKVIGEANDEITPLSLLNVTSKAPTTSLQSSELNLSTVGLNGPNIDIWLLFSLASIYRIADTNPSNQLKIAKKVTAQLQRGAPNLTINTTDSILYKMKAEHRYPIIFAAIDMFLAKFPNNIYHPVRFGTIVHRHEGCSGLMDLKTLGELMGCSKLSESICWLFISPAEAEVENMYKEEEEFENEYSYFPYALSMGVINKSPFSAKENSAIHHIVHILGSLLCNPRSLNARLLPVFRMGSICANVAIIFFASKKIVDERAIENLCNVRIGSDSGEATSHHPKTPTEILAEYHAQGSKLTRDQMNLLREAVDAIPNGLREGSIGKWTKEQFLSNLFEVSD